MVRAPQTFDAGISHSIAICKKAFSETSGSAREAIEYLERNCMGNGEYEQVNDRCQSRKKFC